MNQSEQLKGLKPLVFSPERKVQLDRMLREQLVKQCGEEWVALHEMPSKEDVANAEARIDALQGPSPRDKAWPTEYRPDPPHVAGWSADNRLNLAVAKRVYDEYVAAGKIISRPKNAENPETKTGEETADSKGQ